MLVFISCLLAIYLTPITFCTFFSLPSFFTSPFFCYIEIDVYNFKYKIKNKNKIRINKDISSIFHLTRVNTTSWRFPFCIARIRYNFQRLVQQISQSIKIKVQRYHQLLFANWFVIFQMYVTGKLLTRLSERRESYKVTKLQKVNLWDKIKNLI